MKKRRPYRTVPNLPVRMTPDERNRLARDARAAGVPVSRYVRGKLGMEKPKRGKLTR